MGYHGLNSSCDSLFSKHNVPRANLKACNSLLGSSQVESKILQHPIFSYELQCRQGSFVITLCKHRVIMVSYTSTLQDSSFQRFVECEVVQDESCPLVKQQDRDEYSKCGFQQLNCHFGLAVESF